MSKLDIDMTAAISMDAANIDQRSENWGNPELGNALAEHEETLPERAVRMVPDMNVDEPPGRPGVGMQWSKRNNVWTLVPTSDGIKAIALSAAQTYDVLPKQVDEELATSERQVQLADYMQAVDDFVRVKMLINPMSGQRKLQAEIDDCAWLFCQAAKYKMDAEEKFRYWTRLGKTVTDPQMAQLDALRDYGLNNIIEGAIIGKGLRMLFMHMGNSFPAKLLNKDRSAIEFPWERLANVVLTTSCRKLQQYFDNRSPAQLTAISSQANQFLFTENFY